MASTSVPSVINSPCSSSRALSSTDIARVKATVEKHVGYTGSPRGKFLLENWNAELPKFFKVLPRDYERMLEAFKKVEELGLTGDEAAMAAFEANLKDLARIGGN
mgnify:CR=1 FL=1